MSKSLKNFISVEVCLCRCCVQFIDGGLHTELIVGCNSSTVLARLRTPRECMLFKGAVDVLCYRTS